MTAETFLNGRVTLHPGDCLEVLARLEECSVDSVVTDPPYHLTSIVKRFGADNAAPAKRGKTGAYARASSGFMGKKWDGGDIAFRIELWQQVLRVLKPGGHLLAFSGTRTYHRMACAIEDAGFEVRDQIQWLYGSGFPKSHDVSKGIDRAAGFDRGTNPDRRNGPNTNPLSKGGGKFSGYPNTGIKEIDNGSITDFAHLWQGWRTALKPACEPIMLARKPLSENTVAANVLRWGTGALNIDGCRVETDDNRARMNSARTDGTSYIVQREDKFIDPGGNGRWPANVIHDGGEEVTAAFPETGPSPQTYTRNADGFGKANYLIGESASKESLNYGDVGSAARFFYTSKADSDDRLGSKHPTVKPLDLMQYLVRLVTPPKGIVLDPFSGTGTAGEAAWREGMNAVLIEREAEYQADIRRRMALCMSGPDERAREAAKAKLKDKPLDHGPLFQSDASAPPRVGEEPAVVGCTPSSAAAGSNNTALGSPVVTSPHNAEAVVP